MQARQVPTIPPPEKRLRLLIDTDAATEVDDQHAIALALCTPDRFDLRGFVAAHFGDSGGPTGIEQSAAEIARVLAVAGLEGRFPVRLGSHPLRYSREPSPSEGVDFILSEAHQATQDDPLWIVALGPATNVVSAYLTDPSIVERVVVLYHGRTHWPEKCWNFNVYNDVRAARALFHSELSLALFDTGTYLRLPMEAAEQQLAPHGPLGRYLVDIRRRYDFAMRADKGLFDLGDIALLVDPSLAEWEQVPVPSVEWDLRYDHARPHGEMLRVFHIDREGTFDLLSRSLARHATP
jgi:inosine-uridine nucleoside N-ribohydrolase